MGEELRVGGSIGDCRSGGFIADELENMASLAFVDNNFELACDLFSQAITMEPTKAGLFSNHAQTNIKLKRYTGSLVNPFDSIPFLGCSDEILSFCSRVA